MPADVVLGLEAQEAVFSTIREASLHAGSVSAFATLASMSGKATDATSWRLFEDGVVKPRLSPFDCLFGILLRMAIARQNWVPQQPEAVATLVVSVQRT